MHKSVVAGMRKNEDEARLLNKKPQTVPDCPDETYLAVGCFGPQPPLAPPEPDRNRPTQRSPIDTTFIKPELL